MKIRFQEVQTSEVIYDSLTPGDVFFVLKSKDAIPMIVINQKEKGTRRYSCVYLSNGEVASFQNKRDSKLKVFWISTQITIPMTY